MPNPKKRAEKQEAASVSVQQLYVRASLLTYQSRKNAAESEKQAKKEELEWSAGAKGTSKAEKEAEKKAEQARKREEKARLEAEENASLPSKPAKITKGADKVAAKKSSKIDNFIATSGIERKAPALSATNIDDALDALTISNKSSGKNISTADVDRHPERRFKAAFAAFEERRIAEMKADKSGLRLQQMKEVAFKEFQKSPENPYNQLTGAHNATKEELQDIARSERAKNEKRLAGSQSARVKVYDSRTSGVNPVVKTLNTKVQHVLQIVCFDPDLSQVCLTET